MHPTAPTASTARVSGSMEYCMDILRASIHRPSWGRWSRSWSRAAGRPLCDRSVTRSARGWRGRELPPSGERPCVRVEWRCAPRRSTGLQEAAARARHGAVPTSAQATRQTPGHVTSASLPPVVSLPGALGALLSSQPVWGRPLRCRSTPCCCSAACLC